MFFCVRALKARRAEKVSFNITLNLRTGEFDETRSSDEHNLSDAAEKIKRLLQKHPQMSQREIAAKLRIIRWRVQKVLGSAS
jgi:predicted HTH transcriptional regulator